MARPKPDAQKVHTLVLSKAIQLIQKEGYPQLTMRRLANEAGISVGKIYLFFPSKDALFLELEIFFFRSMIENLLSQPPKKPIKQPQAQLKWLLLNFYQFASKHLDLYRLVTFPPKVYSDFIGDQLEPLARIELNVALDAISVLRNSLKSALTASGLKNIDEDAIQRRFLFLVNALQGLILNSHSPIFPYIASQQKALVDNQYFHPEKEATLNSQLDALLQAVFSAEFP